MIKSRSWWVFAGWSGAVVFGALGVPDAAHGQTLDAVRVLYHGGQSALYGVDLVDGQVTELGAYAFADEAYASLDFKRLPGGGVLLGQASGFGAAVLDDELRLLTVLDPSARYREVTRVAVAGYSAFGVPARILVGDSLSSVVTIRDLQTSQTVWYRGASNGMSYGDVVAVAAAPANTAVVGLRWDDLGISAIDTFDLAVADAPFEIASATYVGIPDEHVVQPLIAGLRDVFVRADGSLLVGTDTDVLALGADGSVRAQLPLAMVGIAGRVSSVKATPTGRIVFSTYAPGDWTVPNENHGVHWWDPGTSEIWSSGALQAAPAAIDLFEGHGGTGTENFQAGLDELANGRIEDIEVVALGVSAERLGRGDTLLVRLVVSGGGSFPVPTSRFSMDLGPGRCSDAQTFAEAVASRDGVIVYPGAQVEVTGTRVIDARISPGAWCLRASVSDAQLAEYELQRVDLEVVDAVEVGQPVESTPLDFRDAPDVGVDASEMDEPVAPRTDDGCGCGSAVGAEWLGLWVFGFWRRRSSKKKVKCDG